MQALHGHPQAIMQPDAFIGLWPGAAGPGVGYGYEWYHDGAARRGNAETRGGEPLAGRVWQMSREAEGCRVLQEALDTQRDEDRTAIADELKGHVWEAIKNKHANHVIQKCIVTQRPEASQFIIDEIMSKEHGVWHASTHVFGCRVVQRLLEHCHGRQMHHVVEHVLQHALGLCKHKYGNFVAQHVYEHGTSEQQRHLACKILLDPASLFKHRYGNYAVQLVLEGGGGCPEQQHQLAKVIREHLQSLCADEYGAAVVCKALSCGALKDRVAVARAILKLEGVTVSMVRLRHGKEAMRHLLEVPAAQERKMAQSILSDNVRELGQSRYGRVIANLLVPRTD